MSFTQALKWSFLAELTTKAIQPAVFVVIARLLSPEDFGIMAAALMVIAFSQIFWEAGMGKTLIQRQGGIDKAARVAFWLNLGLGVVIALILLLVAEPVAKTFFQDLRVTAVLQVMTIQILLGSLASIPIALMQKEMRFQTLFRVRLAMVLCSAFFSIVFAYSGAGYWALVAGAIAGHLMQLLMLWRSSTWRPQKGFDIAVARELLNFGSWVTVSAILAWFFAWGDSFFVGAYLGSHDLGIYRMGTVVIAMLFSLLVSPVSPVAYSQFSMMQQDQDKLREAVLLASKSYAMVLFPVAAMLYVFQDTVAAVMFGIDWSGTAAVIGLTAITQAIAFTVGMNPEAYRSIGRADVETKVMFISAVIRLIFYASLIQFGLLVFMIGRLVSTLLGVVNHVAWSSHVLGLGPGSFLRAIGPSFLFTVIITLIAWLIGSGPPQQASSIMEALLALVLASVVYLLLLFVFEKAYVLRVIAILRSN